MKAAAEARLQEVLSEVDSRVQSGNGATSAAGGGDTYNRLSTAIDAIQEGLIERDVEVCERFIASTVVFLMSQSLAMLDGCLSPSACIVGPQVRLMLLAALSGEHILFIGPPGTAKSELGRRLSRLYNGPFFERLLTRFSVPEVRSWVLIAVVMLSVPMCVVRNRHQNR